MKGHMQDGIFHPHTKSKGVRKSRDQSAKIQGVRIERKARKVDEITITDEESHDIQNRIDLVMDKIKDEKIRRELEEIRDSVPCTCGRDDVKIRKQRASEGAFTEEEFERMKNTGKLIDPKEKEFFRRKVEKLLGNAYLPPIMTFRDQRGDPERESMITIESEIPIIDRDVLNKIKSQENFGLVIDRITKPFSGNQKDILVILTIQRIFADKEFQQRGMVL